MGIEQEVVQWHCDIHCFPTWEEMLEVEYVRKNSSVNMFIDDVIEQFERYGFKKAIDWYERLSEADVIPTTVFGFAVEFYSRDHGHIDNWPEPEALKR